MHISVRPADVCAAMHIACIKWAPPAADAYFRPGGGRLRGDAHRLHLVGAAGRPMHMSVRPADVCAAMHIACIGCGSGRSD